ncbi:SKP1-like protein 14 [Lycium barbarum]|uniref:SKP1-like protein 14 n=1 Tax=Lycium barbarum TaxID=112863 RepID=UPI00293EAAA2|nr:SKP1-like protein 14 [Lycium barbarum]
MASTSSSTTAEIIRMVTLKTSDNGKFYLEESLAFQFELIKNMIKEEGLSIISLPIMVNTEALIKIIEYLKKNAEITASDEGFNNFKKEHLNICIAELYDILVSAHYLKIKDLVDICAWAIYDKIKNKSIKAITEMLEIENDLTPVEEANINKETSGAFEGDENDNTIN